MNAQTGIVNIRGKEWRAIPDAPGYEVSNLGEVRSLDRMIECKDGRQFKATGKILRPKANKNTGYLGVCLGRGNFRHVHDLVICTFKGPRPQGHDASHVNGVKTDNRPENLTWETRIDNCRRQWEHGTILLGERRHNSKLTVAKVRAIRKLYDGQRGSIARLARRYSVNEKTVGDVVSGRTWRWL